MVAQALVGNFTHPTVEQLHAAVREQFPTISLATVYQTVALLARVGLVLELHGGRDGLRCDPETTPHAHAFCRGCGAVTDVPLPTHVVHDDFTADGFAVDQVDVYLYGRCEPCAAGETV
jgi:Fur family peroxide stress response transcriptional regulator